MQYTIKIDGVVFCDYSITMCKYINIQGCAFTIHKHGLLTYLVVVSVQRRQLFGG